MAGLLASFLRARGVLVLGVAGAALFYLDMLDEALAFAQAYGWFLLLGAGVVLYADHHLGQLLVRWDVARSLQVANDPSRVDILRIEARKARERQQLELEAQSKAHKEAAAVKKKEARKPAASPRRPEHDDYNPLTGATSTARYKPSGFARPRGG
ncbi:hypothetical protein SPRG_20650 [Saprolegnia parasitica CBS 223.65]|uniref:Uncharacterized protein n=1 Tax=Saprolegnia parasitica (strain CBS 223.65) TaxID=695850 RepID=A0A067C416_SAPPC|nr:hypothetical protein SPRG_20650 [Saprolegnia parasitica CBS 223.65]KDO25529.1 hypothetical protein SPRG_20650 [Saprolegnia parasitica CBS 223.65]|eukprot:XP_012203759.1 hypothetical protein SPRG_20650 [Saprolegnia parasitica CBS 223.65]